MFSRNPLVVLLAVTCWNCAAAVGLSADQAVPFVIGFERFARHQDISVDDAGALLISELSCTACHASDDPRFAAKRGPKLGGAGNRLRADWVARFIAAPSELHPGTTMPNLLHAIDDAQRAATVTALAAFLSSQVEPFPVLKAGGALPVVHEFWRKGDSQRGAELYHEIGCVACHEPDSAYEAPATVPSAIDALIEQLDPEELEELGLARSARRVPSISHGVLHEKYSSRALTMMLLDPLSERPDARMPSLRLQPAEAADIAAYLMREGALEYEIPVIDGKSDQIESGRRLFYELRCVNCHDTQLQVAPRSARSLDQLRMDASSNCLGQADDRMPRYRLDERQVQSIRDALQSRHSTKPQSASQAVQFGMLQLNCFACHERDRHLDGEVVGNSQGSVQGNVLGGVGRYRKPYFETIGRVDLGDEGRLPPPLTGVGRKLLPGAIQAALGAKAVARRPYMTIRMPAYHPDTVASLIRGLPEADRVDSSDAAKVFDAPQQDMAEIGRELVNTGCVECHTFRGESLPGVIGTDVNDAGSRLQPQWFRDFLRNPASVKPRTRMPTFFSDGRSHRADLLGGNVDRQIAAIWHYLNSAEPLPEKIVNAMSQDYELSPTDRPIILRTFMREAGNHAIAVGLAGGVNFAFDAGATRLAIGWRGRFLDARGTWFERFAPPADPLGDELIHFPADFPFAVMRGAAGGPEEPATSASNITFGGYRIDESGVPTFLYRFKHWEIEDRIERGDQASLVRTWSLLPSGDASLERGVIGFELHAHVGKQLRRIGPMSVRDENGLMVSVISGIDHEGELTDDGDRQRWRIALPGTGVHVIRVAYQW